MRYLEMAPLGIQRKLGWRYLIAAKFRGVDGASRKPLEAARWRSMMVKALGDGSRIRPSILNSLMLIEPLSCPSAA